MQNVIPVSLAQGRGYRGICGKRNFPQAPFERYADDGMIHCRTREEELSKFRDFALKNKSPCSACEFQAKQGISILGIKLLFFSV